MYVVYVCRKVETFASQLKCGLRYYNPPVKNNNIPIHCVLDIGTIFFLLFFLLKTSKKSRAVQGSATYLVSECESWFCSQRGAWCCTHRTPHPHWQKHEAEKHDERCMISFMIRFFQIVLKRLFFFPQMLFWLSRQLNNKMLEYIFLFVLSCPIWDQPVRPLPREEYKSIAALSWPIRQTINQVIEFAHKNIPGISPNPFPNICWQQHYKGSVISLLDV